MEWQLCFAFMTAPTYQYRPFFNGAVRLRL